MCVVEAAHLCMVSRGVAKPGSCTVTTAGLGAFRGGASSGEAGLRQAVLQALLQPEGGGGGRGGGRGCGGGCCACGGLGGL